MFSLALAFTLDSGEVIKTAFIQDYNVYLAVKQFDLSNAPLHEAFYMATAHRIYGPEPALCMYNNCVKLNLISPLEPSAHVVSAFFVNFD